jgi:nucleotide-binding universal stress UspA family protein
MTEKPGELTVRRILVALDASQHSLAALEAAAELAASLGSELLGIFVEDTRLLQLALLPGARQVSYPFTSTSRLDRARMERQLRAQAAQARQALFAACETRHLKWAFRVVRGEVAPEVLAAAMEADLLTLGRTSRPLDPRARLGSTARAAAEQAPHSVLVLHRDAPLRPPTVVAHDGSEAADQALVMAAHLARKMGGAITVLVMAESAQEKRQLQARVAQWLRTRRLQARYRSVPSGRLAALSDAIQSEASGVLVIATSTLPPRTLQALLEAIDCPVLLVR